MKAGFKFPEIITLAEVEAFRKYQERVRPALEAYRIAVNNLNKDYDEKLTKLGDDYELELERLSNLHDAERVGKEENLEDESNHPRCT